MKRTKRVKTSKTGAKLRPIDADRQRTVRGGDGNQPPVQTDPQPAGRQLQHNEVLIHL